MRDVCACVTVNSHRSRHCGALVSAIDDLDFTEADYQVHANPLSLFLFSLARDALCSLLSENRGGCGC